MIPSSLVIETLVNGCMANIWLFLFLNKLFSIHTSSWKALLKNSGLLTSPTLAVAFICLSYILGWLIQFISEISLDKLFQSRFRDNYFKSLSLNFFKIRTMVFQCGTEQIIKDIEFDRHLLRVTKANILNFALISIAVLFYYPQLNNSAIYCSLFGFLLMLSFFFFWKNRYEAVYRKFADIYNIIQTTDQSSKPINHKFSGNPQSNNTRRSTKRRIRA